MNAEQQIEHINDIGKHAQGQREMLKHLKGGHNSPTSAIKAFCYMCMGYYADAIQDCETSNCPLYPRNPYNPNRTKRTGGWRGDPKARKTTTSGARASKKGRKGKG